MALRRDTLQFILPSLLTILLFIVVNFLFILPKTKNILIHRQKQTIEQLVQTTVSIIKTYDGYVQSGALTVEEAKENAKTVIQNLRYGRDTKNYFWIIDTTPAVVMHPYRSDMVHQNVYDYQDENGVYIFREMLELAQAQGEGYLSYLWQVKDEASLVEKKTSFIMLYAPWQWIVGTGFYLEEAYSEIVPLTQSLSIGSGVALIAILILSLFLMNRGIQAQRMREVFQDKLYESEHKYLSLVSFMAEGVTIQDQRGTITYVNDSYCSMVGFEREEIIGRNINDFIYIDQINQFNNHVTRAIEGSGEPFEIQWRRRDGGTLTTVVSLRDIRGRDTSYKGTFAVLTDITRRKIIEDQLKKSLQEKDVLLQEVHHRVKNNLQIISSLLNLQRQQSNNTVVTDALTDSQIRIQSMASIHELLYESRNFDSINLGELLKKILSNLRATYRSEHRHINIDLHIQDAFIEVERAVPWGLIINELISNVFKHAFDGVSGDQCTMYIRLKKNESALRFDIQDNGIGLPDAFSISSTGTLGMELITILAEQIHATIDVVPEDTGAHFVCTVHR